MLISIHPKLPMRTKAATKNYYIDQLGFTELGEADYPDYLMVKSDEIEIHFFLFAELDPLSNYGQVYIRCNDIQSLYKTMTDKQVTIHPNAPLQLKPWGQLEFSLLDPDHNLLTFGQSSGE